MGAFAEDVLSAGFSADGKRVVTGSRDYTLRVWDLEGRRRLAVLSDVYGDDVVSAVFSPVNRSLVASASTDGSAHIWNVDTNTITALKGHNGPVWSIAFNSNGRQVVTASGDMTARVWDAESGQLVQTFKGHSNWVFSAAFTPNDKHVVTASRDKTVRRRRRWCAGVRLGRTCHTLRLSGPPYERAIHAFTAVRNVSSAGGSGPGPRLQFLPSRVTQRSVVPPPKGAWPSTK